MAAIVLPPLRAFSSDLPFTRMFETLTPLGDLVRILAGVGVTTALLALLKRLFERRCWRRFKAGVHAWLDASGAPDVRHPTSLTDEEWHSECERMLTDANFSPREITDMLELGVVVAKGIATDRFIM